jgi:hypothetical protein
VTVRILEDDDEHENEDESKQPVSVRGITDM